MTTMKLLITTLPLTWVHVCQWLGANLNLLPACITGGIFVLTTGIISFHTLFKVAGTTGPRP